MKAATLTCESCDRPYSLKASEVLRAKIQANVRRWPIDEYPFQFGERLLETFRSAGISTAGDLIDAGGGLLEFKGIGPAWLKDIESDIRAIKELLMEQYAAREADR
jgi:hypothetical protein